MPRGGRYRRAGKSGVAQQGLPPDAGTARGVGIRYPPGGVEVKTKSVYRLRAAIAEKHLGNAHRANHSREERVQELATVDVAFDGNSDYSACHATAED